MLGCDKREVYIMNYDWNNYGFTDNDKAMLMYIAQNSGLGKGGKQYVDYRNPISLDQGPQYRTAYPAMDNALINTVLGALTNGYGPAIQARNNYRNINSPNLRSVLIDMFDVGRK